jgi:hypothetical protein
MHRPGACCTIPVQADLATTMRKLYSGCIFVHNFWLHAGSMASFLAFELLDEQPE